MRSRQSRYCSRARPLYLDNLHRLLYCFQLYDSIGSFWSHVIAKCQLEDYVKCSSKETPHLEEEEAAPVGRRPRISRTFAQERTFQRAITWLARADCIKSFAKPAPATSLAEWDESHADQVPLTYASSGKRNLRSELVREHIWPMASRCSMRKIRWIWIYHNKDCHDLAPYAFSERKTPYWEYKDVTLPVPVIPTHPLVV